ncbi:MAG: hypothetical protein COW55_14720 [Rhodobacteraceae bacterium CG17_big_fil_post_rev_8_21_14_2_50_65_11]|nr:MAG: hypothetical protein COW55_14720 [Rhodobacteraceae bacterium CG17_big_fil_post_rev_8_21_14_2_50_65_11]
MRANGPEAQPVPDDPSRGSLTQPEPFDPRQAAHPLVATRPDLPATPVAKTDPALTEMPLTAAAEPVTPISTNAPDRPTAPQAPTPQPVVTQLAQQLAAAEPLPGDDAPLEMTLDPPELGTIRLSVTRGADGMVLHLHADQPETLDLLRRHGGALTEELQRQGLEHGSFSFSGGRDGQTQHPQHIPAQATAPAPERPPHDRPDTASTPRRGSLDRRL